MVQCNSCSFYDSEYDELKQKWDDVIFPGEEHSKKHYCRMFDNNIDEKIISDNKECKRRIEENE